MNKAIIDLETGGFSKEKNGICEIGLIVIDDQCRVVSQYSTLIKPYIRKDGTEPVSYKDKSMAVHGITIDMLEDNGLYSVYVCEHIKFVFALHNVSVFIGHNIDVFDKPWMNTFFEVSSIPFQITNTEDTLKLAKELLPDLKSHSLPNLCLHFGITNNSAHRAMGDCMATLEVYKILKQI